MLDDRYRSFVGLHTLAVRHGMTVGELALMFQAEHRLRLDAGRGDDARAGRRRDALRGHRPAVGPALAQHADASTRPSSTRAAACIEGTNLSEGRGTTRPFELVGAPWLDPWKLAAAMRRRSLPGVRFRPTFFTPTFQKHAGQLCGGVQLHVTDRSSFPAFLTYLLLIVAARAQDEKRFAWRDPPYEYELVKLPIDILCGTDSVRTAIEAGRPRVRSPLPGKKKRRPSRSAAAPIFFIKRSGAVTASGR